MKHGTPRDGGPCRTAGAQVRRTSAPSPPREGLQTTAEVRKPTPTPEAFLVEGTEPGGWEAKEVESVESQPAVSAQSKDSRPTGAHGVFSTLLVSTCM